MKKLTIHGRNRMGGTTTIEATVSTKVSGEDARALRTSISRGLAEAGGAGVPLGDQKLWHDEQPKNEAVASAVAGQTPTEAVSKGNLPGDAEVPTAATAEATAQADAETKAPKKGGGKKKDK